MTEAANPPAPKLTQDQVDQAYRMFYGDGMSVGEIAEALGCWSIYDLTPWLTASTTAVWREAQADARIRVDELIDLVGRLETRIGDLRDEKATLQLRLSRTGRRGRIAEARAETEALRATLARVAAALGVPEDADLPAEAARIAAGKA